MHISFYLPILPILVVLGAYMLTGLILLVPLTIWSNRFISGRRKWNEGIRWVPAIIGCTIAWPVWLGGCIRDEIRYGTFKRKAK